MPALWINTCCILGESNGQAFTEKYARLHNRKGILPLVREGNEQREGIMLQVFSLHMLPLREAGMVEEILSSDFVSRGRGRTAHHRN